MVLLSISFAANSRVMIEDHRYDGHLFAVRMPGPVGGAVADEIANGFAHVA